MAHDAHSDDIYYVPEDSKLPVWTAFAAIVMMIGLGSWLNTPAGESPNLIIFIAGFALLIGVLWVWFGTVIRENHAGLANAQLKRSYVWGMGWFIFSEVMFFAAFFGALFYARTFALDWLGGEGAKGIAGDYLWPEYEPVWPPAVNPDNGLFTPPEQNMQLRSFGQLFTYLPFYNTVILVLSSVTVHWAHTALKNDNRKGFTNWLLATVVLGFIFVVLQGVEYYEAYAHMGLTLGSGIYGSTFFLLTGFHGFHVTLGAVILLVQLIRGYKGHFSSTDQFGFEAGSWYWHFVDVVWLCLFFLVYIY